MICFIIHPVTPFNSRALRTCVGCATLRVHIVDGADVDLGGQPADDRSLQLLPVLHTHVSRACVWLCKSLRKRRSLASRAHCIQAYWHVRQVPCATF